MTTLIMTIHRDANGDLTYDHPEGCTAIELGTGGTIQLNLGTGFNGKGQFDNLRVSQGGTMYELNMLQEYHPPVDAVFPDGARMHISNNLRTNMFIRNDGQDPATGENDLEFFVGISDADGYHDLDPEIRVRSGTGSGTATWVPSNTGS